jgi:hypothetical protein
MRRRNGNDCLLLLGYPALQIVHLLLECRLYRIRTKNEASLMVLKSLLGSLCLLSSFAFAGQSGLHKHFSVSFTDDPGVPTYATLYSQMNDAGGGLYKTIDRLHNTGMTSTLHYQKTLAIYRSASARYQSCIATTGDASLLAGQIRIGLDGSGQLICRYHPYR